MAFQQRDQSGVLFKNDRKEKDSQPDYTGNGMVNGVEVYLSAWIKDGAKGKFMSLAFKAKDEQTPRTSGTKVAEAAYSNPAGGALADMDDDIPF